MSEEKISVWCLLGRKAGDNTQVLALAEELGWGYEEKHICAQPWELLPHLALGVTLAGIDRKASSPLSPPWPDLVITAGRRNEPVARWIQRQSGGATRLVHLGRPWAPLSSWDLIITTPQYFLPRLSNIRHNSLPLHRLSPVQLEPEAAAIRDSLAELPRPWIAVLLGGDSGKFVFTPGKGARLGALCSRVATEAGGSLLVTDSPRTPRDPGDALAQQLRAPHTYYRWGDPGPNPYRGLLALADAFVVTGESMSMLGEAVAMGRPLFIYDLSDPDGPWWAQPHAWGYKPLSHRAAMRWGPTRMRRDIGRIQEELVAGDRATWLSDSTIGQAAEAALQSVGGTRGGGPSEDELARSAEAVRQLVIPR